MYSPVYIQQLVRYEYGFYVKDRYIKLLYLFTCYYWESVKGTGIYLDDVDFHDLSKESKKAFIYKAFIMWTTYMTESGAMVK